MIEQDIKELKAKVAELERTVRELGDRQKYGFALNDPIPKFELSPMPRSRKDDSQAA